MSSEENFNNLRKMKQKYLKEQLRANKWDPDDFAVFLANQRDDGTLKRHQHRCVGI